MINILSKEIKECENSDGTKTNVLEIFYSIEDKQGRFLLKDYNPEDKKAERKFMKLIKEQISKQYLELTK